MTDIIPYVQLDTKSKHAAYKYSLYDIVKAIGPNLPLN